MNLDVHRLIDLDEQNSYCTADQARPGTECVRTKTDSRIQSGLLFCHFLALVWGCAVLGTFFGAAGAPTSFFERSSGSLWAYRYRLMTLTFIRKAFSLFLIPECPALSTASTDSTEPTPAVLLISCTSCNLLLPIKEYGEVHVEIRGSSQIRTGKFT